MIALMDEDGREAALRSSLEADALLMIGIVEERWLPAADPLGDPMLLPRSGDEDPVRLDDLDWQGVRSRFRELHGRAPQGGARQLARRMLAERTARGGRADA
jgi:hypothetical protein